MVLHHALPSWLLRAETVSYKTTVSQPRATTGVSRHCGGGGGDDDNVDDKK